MNKKSLKEGMVYAIPLSDGSYTVAQLYNKYIFGKNRSFDTFTFFNYKYNSLQEIIERWYNLDMSSPFAIATINSKPWIYGWVLLGEKNIETDSIYKNNILKLGHYNNYSTDPYSFLDSFFGLYPWDCDPDVDKAPEQSFIKHLLPKYEPYEKIKYLKDYSTEGLINLLGEEHIRVKERLESNTAIR